MTSKNRDRELVHEYATNENGFWITDHQAVGALCRVVDDLMTPAEGLPGLPPAGAPSPLSNEPYVAGRASGTEGTKTTGLRPCQGDPDGFVLLSGNYQVREPVYIQGDENFLRGAIKDAPKPGPAQIPSHNVLAPLLSGTYKFTSNVCVSKEDLPFVEEIKPTKTVTLVPGSYNVSAPVEVPEDAPITVAWDSTVRLEEEKAPAPVEIIAKSSKGHLADVVGAYEIAKDVANTEVGVSDRSDGSHYSLGFVLGALCTAVTDLAKRKGK